VIRVRDTGIGIEKDNLARIFDMFTQLGEGRGESAGGLGIGLPLTRSLVEMHRGTILAKSEGPGQGTEFAVRLPLADPAEREAPVSRDDPGDPRAGAPEPPSGGRVLLVDDYPDALEPMRVLLEFKGHRVRTAETGEEALEVAEEFRPDVIVLDIGLPGIDGYEVAQRIRGRPWGGDVLLLALTGWGQQKDRDRAREAGFDDHLVKPVDPDLLETLIRERVSPPDRNA